MTERELIDHCRGDAGPLQEPDLGRVPRRAGPHRHRQAPEVQAARPLLGGPRAPGQLTPPRIARSKPGICAPQGRRCTDFGGEPTGAVEPVRDDRRRATLVGCWPSASSRSRSVAWSRSSAPASPCAAGDKVGLTGRNGAGKTSLLRVLAGDGRSLPGRGAAHRRTRLPVPGSPGRPGRRAGQRAQPRPVRSRPRPGRGPAREVPPGRRGARHRPGGRALQPGRGALPSRRGLRGRERGPPPGPRPRA